MITFVIFSRDGLNLGRDVIHSTWFWNLICKKMDPKKMFRIVLTFQKSLDKSQHVYRRGWVPTTGSAFHKNVEMKTNVCDISDVEATTSFQSQSHDFPSPSANQTLLDCEDLHFQGWAFKEISFRPVNMLRRCLQWRIDSWNRLLSMGLSVLVGFNNV